MTDRTDSTGGNVAAVRRRISGRRHGRRLRRGLQRLIEELLPQIALALPGDGDRVDLTELLGHSSPGTPDRLWLEIGFGAGEHLAWQAANNPDVKFLGAEIYVNGIAALLRAIERGRLINVRIFQGDGCDLLDALPDASLERVCALFPDPWPKQRHNRRRLIQESTLNRLARVMRDGAELRLATDHDDYLRWILECACRHDAFTWTASGPADWRLRGEDWPATRYEQKAIAQGLKPVYLRFRRRPR